MEKLKMESFDTTSSNINKIAKLFPNCVTERKGKDGKTELAIDFEKLQVELSDDIIGEGEERYQFTWPDKRAANRLANTPTTMTLRPCREDSVDFDNTQNIYIEGDNLNVLKVLRETYLGKVKMIYIDPPYNTGNDFVYNDDFAKGKGEFEQTSGFFDEEGNQTVDKMQRNTESNGRFHTDWLNMMYPRLKISRNLLTNDGVIFISIDLNEVENLKKICNELYGDTNFVGEIIWQSATDNNPRQISTEHEYILCYAKNVNALSPWMIESDKAHRINTQYKLIKSKVDDVVEQQKELRKWIKANEAELKGVTHYNNVDERGVYSNSTNSSNTKPGGYTFDIIHPVTGKHCVKPEFGWRWTEKTFWDYDKVGDIEWGKDETTQPHVKKRIETVKEQLKSIYYEDGRASTKQLEQLLGGKKIFDNPKSVLLLSRIIKFATQDNDCIILDFFSGSATTAHAIMEINANSGTNKKFIMVQLQEPTEPKSEAYKAGYKNICEIGEERIRRAGKKIVEDLKSEIDTKERLLDKILNAEPSATVKILPIEEQKEIAKKVYEEKAVPLMKEIDEIKERIEKLDTGFRVFKLDTSNMEDVYYTPQEFDEQKLFTDNVKADRTNEDLLFQVMLDLGIELSAKIEVKEIAGKTVHIVDENYLVACFDEDVNETTIKEIAKLKPVYFVMRDASAANDNVIDNFDQLFEAYSKDTVRKIL